MFDTRSARAATAFLFIGVGCASAGGCGESAPTAAKQATTTEEIGASRREAMAGHMPKKGGAVKGKPPGKSSR